MTKRHSIPALGPAQLGSVRSAIAQLPLSASAKQALLTMIIEAATEDRHNVVRVGGQRGRNMQATAERMIGHTTSIMQRAAAGMAAIDDDEWTRLVEDANRE